MTTATTQAPSLGAPAHTRAWTSVLTHAASTGPAYAPTGATQIAYRTPRGVTGLLDVVSWRRLDTSPLCEDTTIEVTVQGRPGPDLRLPLHSTTVVCVLTLDPEDAIDVTVGDLREHGWSYGLRLHGARLLPPGLPLQRPGR